ncbi:hypothetical protein HDG32_001155 [Paraburkholderia sp. CI2]|uniref:hypothetical protein n=1 Tax=unclassified Paraburkholderia TaxID=2615204 RepID=UPI00161188A0|nr:MULTISPECIES: hypothetical protein [unclassified Paraburkholderia]MBB5465051.1 hypothetical protein [Paraburkholderia sp. CI2]MBC8741388.1 hypothetical protein [Paraburkholderia sp. UCT31]
MVDAINDEAASFYKKYGFVPLTDEPLALFLPVTGRIGEPASRDDAARRVSPGRAVESARPPG